MQFVPTAEGFHDFTENKYIYQYKDHLGNTRLTYAKNSAGVLEVLDKNDYYPFGMNHLDANAGSYFGQSSYKNCKYKGKELQETGMYDYGARMFMPDIARWETVDPLAETSRRWNPYTYAFNNPIRFIDPDGREAEAASDSSGGGESGGEPTSGIEDMDANGNQTVTIIGGIKITAGTAAISVSGGSTQEIKERNQTIHSLKAEFKGTGMNPDDTKVAGRSCEVIEKLPSLNKIASAITKHGGSWLVSEYRDNDGLFGRTDWKSPQIININLSAVSNNTLLGFAFSIGHELLHSFDLQINLPSWNNTYGSWGGRTAALSALREVRSYSWMVRMGYTLATRQQSEYDKNLKAIQNATFQKSFDRLKIINP